MNKYIDKWIAKEGRWYQFWLPASGVIGGLIFGSLIGSLISLILTLIF